MVAKFNPPAKIQKGKNVRPGDANKPTGQPVANGGNKINSAASKAKETGGTGSLGGTIGNTT